MDQDRASRGVRNATVILLAMVPIGIALIVIGLLEVRWWHSGDTGRLLGLFDKVKLDNGLVRPVLLRGKEGAFELIALGFLSLGYVCLASFVRKANRTARTWGLAAGSVLLLYTLLQIGSDAAMFGQTTIGSYLAQLSQLKPVPGATAADLLPLFPPAWYSWLEDIAQGLQALAFVAALIALARTAVMHRDDAPDAREGTTDEYGRALRRFANDRRAADAE